MPAHSLLRCTALLSQQGRDGLTLLNGLLHIVFSEVPLTFGNGLKHSLRAKGLAYGKQTRVLVFQACTLAGLLNTRPDLFKGRCKTRVRVGHGYWLLVIGYSALGVDGSIAGLVRTEPATMSNRIHRHSRSPL